MAAAAGYGAVQQRRSGGGSNRYQSLFYRDLNLAKTGSARSSGASPQPVLLPSPSLGHHGSSSVWRDNIGGSDPPPPPCFTLEDRTDRTPTEPFPPPPTAGEFRSPDTSAVKFSDGKSPIRTPQSGASSIGRSSGLFGTDGNFQSPVGASSSPSWWSSSATLRDWSGGQGESDRGNATHQQLHQQEQQGGLLTLPSPRQIIRPDVNRSAALVEDGEEGDEWVTVYGFPGEDTNLVLREFEKCGPIVRHVPGPPSSNWVHIQYQSRQDAQKALRKNGMQLYGALIIGVKPVDPLQRQALTEKSSIGFMLVPPATSTKGPASGHASARPYYLQAGDSSAARTAPTIASPTKSIFSKVVDIVFGF